MSKLIDTELGQFRYVDDGGQPKFLFHCPQCEEVLPMNEEILAGRAPVDHQKRINGIGQAIFCTFKGTHELGSALVSTMQAMRLMGYMPYHDEGQDRWQPSRSGGVDGPL